MTKQEWIFRLRRCTRAETLEKVAEHQNHMLEGDALYAFNAAADHRRAELVAGRLFDKIPKSLWRHVR
ncbi:Hha/YmoA family nucleoid-associated regulatory protein [Erwinia sp. JH02]|uniref:Hha/YmoA family nucleoid-associated regulatory protein n=1 Tax=Erwinia sp. JH02 TaxID=2733394 RepID=UPI001487D2D4|nr:Hha/YmoA family nucleoid-associated regulatory protein [Erwinia sp. JH02]NNS09959.1 transcriptional regulator [Erwinia sp. JH02]